MKTNNVFFTIVAAAGVFSGSTFATSLKVGPYITKTVGVVSSGDYVTCSISTSAVSVMEHVGGKMKLPTVVGLKLDGKKLEAQIRAASKATENKALHVVMAIPPVSIVAGIYGDGGVKTFNLFNDGSALVTRNGQDAADLLAIVTKHCEKSKPAGSPREK